MNPFATGERAGDVGRATPRHAKEPPPDVVLDTGGPSARSELEDREQRTGTDAADGDLADAASVVGPDPDVAGHSTGTKRPLPASEDEDEEGRNDSQQRVEEGVEEADCDQRLQASLSSAEHDRTGRQPTRLAPSTKRKHI